ncbi:hypothetical protein F4803DRAFT_575627 [Xylaria telfairii]|nr:hypothetical protein F4803DRAFT_575627 [Xylaria telfairii]
MANDLLDTWFLSLDEFGSRYTYPNDFIPWRSGRPPWRRRQENDHERLQDQRSIPESVTHKTHAVTSSSFSGREQEEGEDCYSDTAEWVESVVAVPPPIDGQEDAETCVNLHWRNCHVLNHIWTCRNGYRSYLTSYSNDGLWDQGDSDWDRCSWHDLHENNTERPSDVDYPATGSNGASPASLCDSDETVRQIEYVTVLQAQPTAFRACREPSIGDVLYVIKLWLVSMTRHVTDAVKHRLALVRECIRQAYYNKMWETGEMWEMPATTTRPNQQQEDDDVD